MLKIIDLIFITCDDIAKLLFVTSLKHLKHLFDHFNPLSVLFISQQMWHPSSKNLSDFQMLLQNKFTVESDLPTFWAISQTVNLASSSMISFIFETIS